MDLLLQVSVAQHAALLLCDEVYPNCLRIFSSMLTENNLFSGKESKFAGPFCQQAVLQSKQISA